MRYEIRGTFNGVEHAIFSKTKTYFYKRFKALLLYLPAGEYAVYTVTKGNYKPLFQYEKQPNITWHDGTSPSDQIRPYHRLTNCKANNLINNIL